MAEHQALYSMEMALKSYRSTIEVHREGKAYKDMMSKMYYVDGDLKNDTVQFDLAVERFKINNGYIEKRIKDLMEFETNSLYDIENFCVDNESNLPLRHRFGMFQWIQRMTLMTISNEVLFQHSLPLPTEHQAMRV